MSAVRRRTHRHLRLNFWSASKKLIVGCRQTVSNWMEIRRNSSGWELVSSLMVGGVQIAPLDTVRNLGVLLDDELTMANLVNSVVRGFFFQLRQIQSVQRSLTRDAKKAIVHAFVASRIDYCNSFLYGTTERVLHLMQVVLNAAARLVVGAGRREHITPILRELHCFLFDNGFCTRWLSSPSTVSITLPRRISLRCLHPRLIFLDDVTWGPLQRGEVVVPRTFTERYGPRSFRSAGPAVWNSLPCELRDKKITLSMFGRKLKTFLFSQAFS